MAVVVVSWCGCCCDALILSNVHEISKITWFCMNIALKAIINFRFYSLNCSIKRCCFFLPCTQFLMLLFSGSFVLFRVIFRSSSFSSTYPFCYFWSSRFFLYGLRNSGSVWFVIVLLVIRLHSMSTCILSTWRFMSILSQSTLNNLSVGYIICMGFFSRIKQTHLSIFVSLRNSYPSFALHPSVHPSPSFG